MNEKMNRMEFLKSLGLKGASLFAVYCAASGLSSCVNESMDPTNPTGGTGNELLLDLNATAYTKLNTVGNYVVVSGIVIARVSTTAFAAVTQVCSHEGKRQVVFNSGEFYCPAHGARFDTAGKGLNSTGSKGLKTYATSLEGTTLKVTV
ncbi:MAG: Rieske 2Fe-2S domain-containing protein [Algoriphagus sp.]|jgi:cytochrome b6-f complex iron-sulfur subunit|uniref:ubiquinol-cytochrome c reductase iron-sulfur subunit n=1 Tax=Algoriphagus sp. TaxID=1872435 RepID=UPI002759E31E|nr:Rieske 2Fe-2S domain-containing protein [Algoriphagus sp.]